MVQKDKENETITNLAFNQGSDARIRGAFIERNPYLSGEDGYRAWRRGWLDVHSCFGKDARWEYDPLPPVR